MGYSNGLIRNQFEIGLINKIPGIQWADENGDYHTMIFWKDTPTNKYYGYFDPGERKALTTETDKSVTKFKNRIDSTNNNLLGYDEFEIGLIDGKRPGINWIDENGKYHSMTFWGPISSNKYAPFYEK